MSPLHMTLERMALPISSQKMPRAEPASDTQEQLLAEQGCSGVTGLYRRTEA